MSAFPGRHEWIAAAAAQPLQTPAYVYSMPQIASQMRALQAALGTPLVVVVAACNNPDVLARLPEDVRFGARCASRHEMNIVSAWRSDHLYMGMPALDAPSARAALGGRYRIVVDSPGQLETLAQLRGARRVAPVTLSLARTIAGAPGPALQGMDREAFGRALELALRYDIQVGGLHMHAGRHGFRRTCMKAAVALRELAAVAEGRLDYRLQTINFGGGLEEDWWARGHDFVAYSAELARFPSHLQPMHEIGRGIFAAAGAFLTRVVSIKSTGGQSIAVCDGGRVQAEGLARSGVAYPLVLRNGQVVPAPSSPAPTAATVVCGASASDDDVLARVAQPLQAGDLLAFSDAGAYMQSCSPTQYLGYPAASAYVCS